MIERLFVLALICFSACHDSGEDHLAHVKTQYAALVQARATPQSKDFDALLAELNAIPDSSPAHAEAQRLARGIEAARRARVARPLAVGAASLPPLAASPALVQKLEQTRAECERLARELTALDAGARAEALTRLDACRRQSDALEDAVAHDPGDGGQGP